MVRMKTPPEWEVQVTREVGDGLEIETYGPLTNREAQLTARRLKAERPPATEVIEINRITEQQELLQW